MTVPGSSAHDAAELALSRGQWQCARDEFLARLARDPSGGAYEGLAQALWWLDDGAACLQAREAGFRAHHAAGDDLAAGAAAASLAYDSLLFGEGEAVARGWLARAAALLDGRPEVNAHGWLAVREAELALATHSDPEAALSCAQRAVQVGRRVGDDDLTHVGTALSGLALVVAGSPASGRPRLDAAAAAATSGEVGNVMWMGKIMCWLIAACQETSDLTRAQEWCRRVEVICRRQNLQPLFTVCRSQHSSVLIAGGTWDEAETDLTAALDSTSHSRRHTRLDAVVLLGELRRRQGRFDEAEALLRQAEFDPTAIVSMAHLRLAQGRSQEALAAIRILLRRIPRTSRFARARVLLPAVRASYAVGDRAGAERAAAELREIAELLPGSAASAASAVASAMLAGAELAPEHWHDAVRYFHDAQLPYEEAESRLGLARALSHSGDTVAAVEQVKLSMRALESLGASAALVEAAQLEDSLGDDRRSIGNHGLTDREVQVIRMVAAGRTNQQIADALVLSPHTVHRHVANILTKLDQPSRAAAAAFAAMHGLL